MDRPPGRGPGRRPRRSVADPPRRRGATTALPAARHRGHVPDERPVPGDRGSRSCATGSATSWSAARGSTRGARSRTRWPTCASCAPTRTASASSGSSTSRPAAIGDKTIEVAARRGGPRGRHDVGRDRGGRHAASWPGSRRGPATRWPTSRSWSAGCGPGSACCSLPELLDEVARGVRLPGDARRRLGGRRGALGQPARAARGHDALRRPRAGRRARPAARGDGARRRPGLVRGRRRRGDADHAPRGEGPRVPGRVHRRARGGPLPAQPGARRREGARGGAPARLRRASPGPSAGCTCRTPGGGRPGGWARRPCRRGSCSRSRPS